MDLERESDNGNRNNEFYEMQKNMEIKKSGNGNGNGNEINTDLTCGSGDGYIEHPVSKFDTLAGVAIKYGVEVGDIKRMNALVSDLQMFALKSLHIPTPGKHPPSPRLSDHLHISRENSSEQKMSCDLFDSFQSLRVKSPTLGASLEAPYIPSADQKIDYQSTEMTTYKKEAAPLKHKQGHHRKSRSLISGFPDEFTDIIINSNDGGGADPAKGNDKLVRRRQKSLADFSTAAVSDGVEVGKQIPIFMDDVGESITGNGISYARRSSSTSNLQDTEKGSSSSSKWSTSWNLKTDLQPFSSAVVSKSLFDAMPKPIIRFKASMD